MHNSRSNTIARTSGAEFSTIQQGKGEGQCAALWLYAVSFDFRKVELRPQAQGVYGYGYTVSFPHLYYLGIGGLPTGFITGFFFAIPQSPFDWLHT